MIYTEDQKASILYQAQVWLSELGLKVTRLERSMEPCGDLYCEGYRVRVMMSALQRSPLTDIQEEHIYTCMAKLTDVKDYPAFTPLTATKAPSIIVGSPGPAGPPGQDGEDGTSANIDVRSNIDSILIEETQEGAVKVFTMEDNTYIEATITLNLDPSASVVEEGTVDDITLNINLIKGRDNVVSSVITSDPTLDIDYQAILDLPALNAGGPTLRSVVKSAIDATTTWTVNINDGTTINTVSKTRTYVFPFFHGSTPTEPINPYSDLTKLIATKSTKNIAYDADLHYFWFCFPASYGDLSSIKDQNGFEVLSAFTKIVDNVTSTGLDVNWTESYHLYRTTALTNIHGTYTFTF